MTTFLLRSVLGLAAIVGFAATASAQVVISGYAPPAVYVPAPAPITTYYSPSPGVSYGPGPSYYAPPVTTYYAPPVVQSSFYAPGVTTYAPVVAGAPAVVYRPNPVLFPRRRVVVAPYGAPYYYPAVTNRVIIP